MNPLNSPREVGLRVLMRLQEASRRTWTSISLGDQPKAG